MIPPMKEFVSLGDCIINLNQIAFVQNFPAGVSGLLRSGDAKRGAVEHNP